MSDAERPEGERQSWLTRQRAPWLFILAAVLASGLLGVVSFGSIRDEFNRPLGPTLPPLPTLYTIPTPNVTQEAADADASNAPQNAVEIEIAITPEPTTEPLCSGPSDMVILAVGTDEIGLADVIRVTRVDFVKPSVAVLAFPRDLWVAIPGLGPHGGGLAAYFGVPRLANSQAPALPGDYSRINVAYSYGNLYDLPGRGPGTLAQTLNQNFGLPVEHYVAADMAIVENVIDAVGGVDLYLPNDIGGFSAGWHHMNGGTALTYARMRKMDNDWFRIDRQNQVLLALRTKALQPETLQALPSIVDSLLDDTTTDLSKAQISSLICLATRLDSTNITTATISRQMVTPTSTTRGSYIMLPHDDEIRALVAEFLSSNLAN